MNPVNNITRVIQLIRKQTKKTGETTERPKYTDTQKPKKSTQKSIEDLQNLLLKKIKSLSAIDGDSKELVIGTFVHTVLCWEFGENVACSPKFPDMVDTVTQELLKNKNLVKNILILARAI